MRKHIDLFKQSEPNLLQMQNFHYIPPPAQNILTLPPPTTINRSVPPPILLPPTTIPPPLQFSQGYSTIPQKIEPLPTSPNTRITDLAKRLEENQIQELHGLEIYKRNLLQIQFHESAKEEHYIVKVKIDFIETLIHLGQLKLKHLLLIQSMDQATTQTQNY